MNDKQFQAIRTLLIEAQNDNFSEKNYKRLLKAADVLELSEEQLQVVLSICELDSLHN